MKILHVIDSEGLYGAEMVVLALMESQRKAKKHSVLLSLGCTGAGLKRIETESRNRGLEVITIRFRNGFNLKGAKQIVKIAFEIGAQIIHSHGYKPDILLGFLPRRWRRIPVVSTLHGWTATSLFSKMGLYKLLDIFAMTRLESVISVSYANSCKAVFRIFGTRPAVINNGIPLLRIDNDWFENNFPEIASLCKNRFSIISVGRLSPEKGFSVLLEAVRELIKDGVNAFLVIVGEGPEKVRLQELTKANCISEKVAFLGYQSKAYRFMPHFDIFVLPSLKEGFPVTILEAMQARIPIVGTRVGEVSEILENGALGELANTNDPISLASAIRRVYEDKEKARRKAQLCQAKAFEKYSIESMCNAYSIHYNHVIQNWKKSL